MAAAGLWDKEDLQKMERRILRRARCLPRDVKGQTITKLVQIRSPVDTIIKRASSIQRELR